jgi:hypothetical protein
MVDLKTLQNDFSEALFSQANDSLIQSIHNDGLSAEARLQVHKNNMTITLTEALASIYLVLHKLVGEDFFKHMARAYLTQHPPTSGALLFFGGDFADFIASFKPAASLSYLPDVARLEWSRHQVFNGPDCEPLAIQSLNKLNQTQMGSVCFKVNPNHRIIKSFYPLLKIWQANQDGADDNEVIDINSGAQNILIARGGFDVWLLNLSETEVDFFEALKAGHALNDAINADGHLSAFEVSQTLQKFIKYGALKSFSIK